MSGPAPSLRSAGLLLVVVLVGACSSTLGGFSQAPPDGAAPPSDAASPTDAAAAPPPDLAPDLSPDVAPDLSPDVAPDLSPDVAPDLSADLSPDLAPDAPVGVPIVNGFTLNECETSTGGTACGRWVWAAARSIFVAEWTQGARADIALIENGERVVFHRIDPTGISQGLSADYTGRPVGDRKLEGVVTWRSPAGVASGTWTATW